MAYLLGEWALPEGLGMADLCAATCSTYGVGPCAPSLIFTTCDVDHGNTDARVTYTTSSGTQVELDNAGNDRERGQADVYSVPPSSGPFTVANLESDGWCIDSIVYDGAAIALCSGGVVWLDNPVQSSADYGGAAAFAAITIDPTSLVVTNCNAMPPPRPAPQAAAAAWRCSWSRLGKWGRW